MAGVGELAAAPGGALDPVRVARERASQGTPPQSLPNWSQFSPQQQADLTQTYTKTKAAQNPGSDPVAQVKPPANITAIPPNIPGQTPVHGPGSPTPAPPVDPNAPPQLKMPETPVPQYTVPDFKGATYKPPNRGLEYLAAGLALLFPGAPIARAAAGFVQGMERGAQQRYDRDEGQAEAQFKVAEAKARGDFENAGAQYNAGLAKSNVDFKNAQTLWAQHQAETAQGKYFKPPAELTRILPPGTNRAPTPQDYANHYAALAREATRQGASDLVTSYSAQANDWMKQSLQDRRDALSWSKMIATFRQQDHLENVRETHQDIRDANREAIAAARAEAAEARRDSSTMDRYRQEATRAGREFSKLWMTATRPTNGERTWGVQDPKTKVWTIVPPSTHGAQAVMADKQGHVAPFGTPLPAEIGNPTSLAQLIKQIQRAPDPSGLADHFADAQENGTVKQVLQAAGTYADLSRRAAGGAVVTMPESWYEKRIPKPKPPVRPQISAELTKLKAAGIDPHDPEAMTMLKQDGFSEAEIAKALAPPPSVNATAAQQQHGYHVKHQFDAQGNLIVPATASP